MRPETPVLTIPFLFLFLFLLLSTSEGNPLKKHSPASIHKVMELQEESLKAGGSGEEAAVSRDGCMKNIKRWNRKVLMIKRTEAMASSTKYHAHSQREDIKSVKEAGSFSQEQTPEPYPDILDIAGMDYSPAMKKPPIHN